LNQNSCKNKIREPVANIIEEYLPSFKCSEVDAIDRSGPPSSHMYALRLIHADRSAYKELGYSPDILDLTELRRDVQELITKIDDLSAETVEELTLSSLFPLNVEDDNCAPKFYSSVGLSKFVLRRLLNDVTRVKRRSKYFREPTQRRNLVNWRAASVAKVALDVWGRGTWDGPITRTPVEVSDSEIKDYLENGRCFAHNAATLSPSANSTPFELHMIRIRHCTEKMYTPGPLGRFLQALFQELEIVTEDGEPIEAATALKSLKKIRKEFQK